MPLGLHLLAVHNRLEVPLVARPTHGTVHFDIGVKAIHADLRHPRALLLVNRQVVGPAENRRRPRAVHHRHVVGIILVEFFNVAELPGSQHVRQRVINLLLVSQRNQRLGGV